MLEIKAVKELENVHLAQAINYLEAYGMEIGLPVNFENTSLPFKRVMKPSRIIVPVNIAKYGSKIKSNREVKIRQIGNFVYRCK